MKYLILALSITIISSQLNAGSKCNYSTSSEKRSAWGGAPWAYGTWSDKYSIPDGPCEYKGRLSEFSCIEELEHNELDCYQMTNGHFSDPQGSYWNSNDYDYKRCYICYDNGDNEKHSESDNNSEVNKNR